ncbi:MAG TPA: PqqD family protein [Candidatus Limnocylindrales bacterium]|nr:PqqD family protein [Candidatus Limnocylindrales bacterium]
MRNVRGTMLLAWQETFLELADVAGFLWRQLDGVRTVDELVALIAAEYDVEPGEVAEDVHAVLADLVQAGFIALRSRDEPIRHWY